MNPKELKYLESHEWAGLEAETGLVVVGLAGFAIEQLGDIVFLELPGVGDLAEKEDLFGTIESIKAASDLYAPVTGEIVEVNEELPENLELFKGDPYEDCWLIKIKPDDIEELESLMDATAYEEYLKGQ